jgi:hypothetical protein
LWKTNTWCLRRFSLNCYIVGRMNQAISFFWTILGFSPVLAFWVVKGVDIPFCICAGLAILSLLLPARLLQLSNRPRFYEGLGVKFIRKLVQNGEYANRLIRSKNAQYKVVKNKAAARRYMSTIVMYERFHFLCFVFFLLTALYSFAGRHYFLFGLILLSNGIYNLCPILLQQYNRARVLRLKTPS